MLDYRPIRIGGQRAIGVGIKGGTAARPVGSGLRVLGKMIAEGWGFVHMSYGGLA